MTGRGGFPSFAAAGGSAFAGRSLPVLWLAALGCLLIALRLPHLGHMLAWDEAWNLCALKYRAGGGELFTHQLWRHPPLYMALGSLLAPLQGGFEYRMQLLSLLLNVGSVLFFVHLVSRLYGRRIALFAGLSCLLLPGGIFFDTWVKRDPAVTLFGVMALWAVVYRRDWLAGLWLGLALLSKETAVFYGVAAVLFILCREPWRCGIKRLLVVCGLALAVAGWWYLLLARGGGGFVHFFLGSSAEARDFGRPWWTYFAQLRIDLGWPGLLLMLTGILALGRSGCHQYRKSRNLKFTLSRYRFLPFYLLLPAYLLLSFSHGKPFWMTISLLPFWTLLVGVGCAALVESVGGFFRLKGQSGRLCSIQAGVLVVIVPVLALPVVFFDYVGQFDRYSKDFKSGLGVSYEIVSLVNEKVSGDERLLLLPMLYRNGPAMPDPVFFWYLKGRPDIYRVVDLGLDYQGFRKQVIDRRIAWALMSPVDGSNQWDILKQLVEEVSPEGFKFSGGVLIRTSGLWEKGEW